MLLQLKRLALRGFILFVKLGANVAYYSKQVLRPLLSPVRTIAHFFVSIFGVPLYRGLFLLRRFFGRIYVPGKNKFMYFLTNRYAIHTVVILLAFTTTAMNVQASGVRADDFGQESLLYEMVTGQTNRVVAVRADTVTSKPSRYLGSAALSVQSDIDFHTPADDYVATTSGGSAIIALTISESGASVAPRTEKLAYTVKDGDTIGTIAQAHGISLNTLLWANNITAKSTIRPGDTLQILPVDGLTHKVKSGDTILAIARKYDAAATEITEFNNLTSSSALSIGEELIIPNGVQPAAVPAPRSVARVFTSAPSTSTPTGNPNATAPSTAASGRMVWPTDLHIITQYFGWKHTGVDIDCHFDNNNYAADDGVVQYSGWKGGYGLTVEINHGNGLVTRYGHHAKLYVSNGQTVAKGQALGLCGTTGNSTGTHLHFEVISGGRFTNPLEYVR
ncbi:hypothetical protein COV06_03225 [Candidatus Uhrbacteria bacterium CG10_big_fil_rev_8_21_14_0_10_50_16]|uniref:LysM domain-containing protein n=1 Tax=Candidatus Uhrbacteria bacterium CG10_big_fil_rev_8_21_14_0_10_50_16 TaxID=1975039 RepID=A0A2H0RN80_9BACT|nr:MAG: hypothetical protein COV06_03225 [Candidatus Uhrbacteria bacterium CG10_big_fil_rev_8_21_14_0_10_50_16]